jgi:hypothetical protein
VTYLCTGKLPTLRVVNRRAHGSGSGDPVIVDGLVGSDDDAVALPSVYVNVITGQRLVADPVYFDDLPTRMLSIGMYGGPMTPRRTVSE